uniref:Uncharacterized protein n=1 Tax=Arundo donax TaxID=35708 RepID=A0A0A9BV81_ARUDO
MFMDTGTHNHYVLVQCNETENRERSKRQDDGKTHTQSKILNAQSCGMTGKVQQLK